MAHASPLTPGRRTDSLERWHGKPGTVGTVAVVGLGKIGLPLAAQYGSAGWRVIGVDVLPAVVDSINQGQAHFAEEPGLADRVAQLHADGLLTATTRHADAASQADVVVVVVPLMLSPDDQPDYRHIDAATEELAAGLQPGTLVIYETTLPVGDTRSHFGPMLAGGSGLRIGDPDDGFLLAFSPERVFSGRIFEDLAAYPKLVGGLDDTSTDRAARFYKSVLPAKVRSLDSAEAAEFAKLAETTYRDVNIALANEFARYAETVGVDILEVIDSANSQPYSHIHQPGIGVGGHCIPVYPHFIISRAENVQLIHAARRINNEQARLAVTRMEDALGDLRGTLVLVLGLTYRSGVRELANSTAIVLIKELRSRGVDVWAYDDLLTPDEIRQMDATPYGWGEPSEVRAIVTQTADPLWAELNFDLFQRLELLYDGRNSLRISARPERVRYLGVGVAE